MNLLLQHVYKSYDGQPVLNNISAAFEGVRSLVLIGPSGGGKSTLLRLIAGLETPGGGSILLHGKPIPTEESALHRYRARMGIVFQAYNLFPHLTALENLTLPLVRVHGLSRGEARERAMESFRRFRLEDHAAKRPAQLSGGQQQRVAIARAIAIRPGLLLFDEPTSALDPEMTAEVLQIIEELREAGSDLVLVTHGMAFARRVADRVAFLHDGELLENGTPEQVFDAPESEACRRFLAQVFRY